MRKIIINIALITATILVGVFMLPYKANASYLTVSCLASPSLINTNQSTIFISSVSGGNGSYTYLWSGACSGYGSNCSNTFPNPGNYIATVFVTSESQTATANCSINVNSQVNNYDHTQCYNNDVYWYDSQGNRQELYQSCSNNYYDAGSNYCIGNSVYRQNNYNNGGCFNGACYNTGNNNNVQLIQTCGYNQTCQNGYCVNTNNCECSYGQCCDGCHYKPSYTTCNTETQNEYGCPWGFIAGSDVGFRTKTRSQYCNGYSASCTGTLSDWIGLSNWTIAAYCNTSQTCVSGFSACQPYLSPAPTPIPTPTNYKGCYDNDIYWYKGLTNVRLGFYKSCADSDACTFDSCDGSICTNLLKCDGTTCAKTSADYITKCTVCGNGVCDQGETLQSCSQDCNVIGLAVTAFGKKENDPVQWTKYFTADANQNLDFLIVISNGLDITMNDVSVKSDLPSEVIYKEGLKLEGNDYSGDIRSGIILGSLAPKITRTITFKGQVTDNNSILKDEVDILATITTSAGSSQDTVKVTLNKTSINSNNNKITTFVPQKGLAGLLGINLSNPLYLFLIIIVIILVLLGVVKMVQGFRKE